MAVIPGGVATKRSGRLRQPRDEIRPSPTPAIARGRDGPDFPIQRDRVLTRAHRLARSRDESEDAPSAPLSLGDRAVATLDALAQRRRLSLGKAGGTQGVDGLAIDQRLIDADRRAVERRGIFGVEPRDIDLGFRLRFWCGELNRPIARFG